MATAKPSGPPPLSFLVSPAELGRAVHAARTAAGLSRSAVARQAGVGRQLLIRLEAGTSAVRIDNALAVMHAVGLTAVLLPLEVVRELVAPK